LLCCCTHSSLSSCKWKTLCTFNRFRHVHDSLHCSYTLVTQAASSLADAMPSPRHIPCTQPIHLAAIELPRKADSAPSWPTRNRTRIFNEVYSNATCFVDWTTALLHVHTVRRRIGIRHQRHQRAYTENVSTMHPRSRAPGSRSRASICTRPYVCSAAEEDRFANLIASV
jgi:hypothetical protein